MHRDIVHAVIHQILPDRVVAAGEKRDLELGAHAVGRGNQHRRLVALQKKASAEASNVGQHARRERAPSHFPNRRDSPVGFVDIYASLLIGDLGLLGHCELNPP